MAFTSSEILAGKRHQLVGEFFDICGYIISKSDMGEYSK
jgi:hypothetical protein